MNKKLKKILMLILSLTLVLSLGGCSKDNESRTSDIPKDGIIKASVFKELKDSSDMALFNGEDRDLKYQWMFLGNDIEEPEDLNLLINAIDKNTEEVKIQTKSEVVQGFEFKESKNIKSEPALSITLDKPYNITSAQIYKYDEKDKTITKVSGATVQNSDDTIINFSVLDREGEFYIVGSDPKQEEIDSDKDSINESDKSKEQDLKENVELKDQSDISANPGKTNKSGKDKYLTDPIPEGKPKPVEPENTQIDKTDKKYATLSIRCDTLLKPENMKVVTEKGKGEMVPEDGTILANKQVEFYDGESVFDVLLREVKSAGIHMEYEFTPMYNSSYIEGINNLYEFDGGELSGWMYKVNGWFPNYGCSRYEVKPGDVIEWVYTCDLGEDVGRVSVGGN